MSLHCTLSKDKLHGETSREMGFACGNGLRTLLTSHCNATSVQRDHFNSLPPQPIHFHQIIIWTQNTLLLPHTKFHRHATNSVTFQINNMCFMFLYTSSLYSRHKSRVNTMNGFLGFSRCELKKMLVNSICLFGFCLVAQ